MSDEKKFSEMPPAYTDTSQQGYPTQQQGYPTQQQGYPTQQYGYPNQYPSTQTYPQGQTQHVVVTQPTQMYAIPANQQPRDWMVPSILVCLFCFWPTGICAIVQASNSRSALTAGDLPSAQRNANSARNLVIASVVLGVIVIAVVIILRVVLLTTTKTYTYNY